jgi:hypothetical protein
MLVHPEETVAVPTLQAITKCSLFQKNLTLATAPYAIKSPVTLAVFRAFVSELEGKAVTVTDANVAGLQRLCDELGFDKFAAKLSKFRPSVGVQNSAERLAALEETAKQHDGAIAVLRDKLERLAADFGRLAGEVSAPPPQPIPRQLSTESGEPQRFRAAPKFDSRIVSGFPEIFAEFRGKRFEILWRGSRDGFEAANFHRRCDGRANTLTVILDTDGNVFGGFTPVRWESRVHNGKGGGENNCWKADESLRSFLFTLRNPHNVRARRCALKAERKAWAVVCSSGLGPCFGGLWVHDNCNAENSSFTSLGNTYTNDTGLDDRIVFAGSWRFRVREIEVFEIAD